MKTGLQAFAAAIAVAPALLVISVAPRDAVAQEMNPVQIDEWPTPWQGRGRDPYAAGPDEIWFVGQQGHYLGRFTPSTEEFFKVDLPAGTGPHNNIVQSNGKVWYSGNAIGELIGIYDPKSAEFTTIEVPGAQDPHTLVFDEDEAQLFFTVQFGNQLGRVTLADRTVQTVTVQTPSARPYGIKIAPDGTPWVVLLGANKLVKLDPVTLAQTEIELPHADARPRRLEITSDGRIWYADWDRSTLGLYDPASGRFDEFSLPDGGTGRGARPYGMASDELDRVWLVATGANPNLFVGFDTDSEEIISITGIPSGARSVRHMDYDAGSGAVWFATDAETIGRAIVRPR
jgi:virginiamycin B lyase